MRLTPYLESASGTPVLIEEVMPHLLLPDVVNATKYTQTLLAVVRWYLMIIQIPLIIVMAFSGVEYGELHESASYMHLYPAFIQARYHCLLILIVAQTLTVPVIIATMITMRPFLMYAAVAEAGLVTISSLVIMITVHLGSRGVSYPGAVLARSWFGFILAVAYIVPLTFMTVKQRQGRL